MSGKHRLEDLGVLSEKLRMLSIHDVFGLIPGRKKDFCEYFYELEVEKQWDLLHELIYGIDHVQEKILECLNVADGSEYESNENFGRCDK